MCTYEKPSSSELTSLDPVLVQQTQSSAELTVHLTLSRTESGLATYETVSDCKRECGYDNIETNRKLSLVSEGCSYIQERAPANTVLVSGEKGIQQPPALCDQKEENKDHVYAVVHKERKGRASSGVSALEKTAGHPQEEASGLLVQWASCVDQSPSLTSEDRSSHQTDSGLDNNTEAAGSETPQAGGNTEYLYAAVDKTKKKKKPPQKPAPYRGLVYADLIISRENSAKLVKEQPQTVYSLIDPVKKASVKISQKNPEETKDGEHK
ncbi:unnamed protein product [Pocillopora meandrina]|uniref:Uncharacterized protein n=1 Tax=Pocillopora meandrina TaxID=46732 RepID=A0AAU9WIE3_9CNID|nr:unnamed protein product [Pocillopora meandrina]